MQRSLSDRVLEALACTGRPPVDTMAMIAREVPATLLAVCPNSRAVTTAALRAAHAAQTPLLLAATLNQVDVEDAYTTWTPSALRAFVADTSERLSLRVPVFTCLDHGGPWRKDTHVVERLSYGESLRRVKRSVEACIDAGYTLLHLDPTGGTVRAGETAAVETMVDRTLDLFEHAEGHRKRRGRAQPSYEVGTEEVGSVGTSIGRFAAYVDLLFSEIQARGLPKPIFLVGDVGTTLDSTGFDPRRAATLVKLAAARGAVVKAHYSDEVEDLAAYPVLGIGGANVGPRLSAVEFGALAEAISLERELGCDSGLEDSIESALMTSGRWRKWLPSTDPATAFYDVDEKRRRWMIETGSRYVWQHPAVVAARVALARNVSSRIDLEVLVLDRLVEAISAYINAFNLAGLNERLLDALD